MTKRSRYRLLFGLESGPKMHLWLSRQSDMTLQAQLATQIRLGVLCGDLLPGQKLPSARELGRRLKVHSNTVSAAYRELEDSGCLESRQGSGTFVTQPAKTAHYDAKEEIEVLVARLFRFARDRNLTASDVRQCVERHLSVQSPARFVVAEPDTSLREIVLHEIRSLLTFPVEGCSIDELVASARWAGAVTLMLPSKTEAVRLLLPPHAETLQLAIESIAKSVKAYVPAPPDTMIAIASRWQEFLALAQAMIESAGVHPDRLIVRNTDDPRWREAVRHADFLVCDSLTAASSMRGPKTLGFRLLSDTSRKKLAAYDAWLRQNLQL